MKKLVLFVFISLTLGIAAFAQTNSTGQTTSSHAPSDEKPKKTIFRASKDQIKEVQTKLKAANLYSGEVTGKLDDATRASIKSWQKDNGLKETGTLNRATLEKMGIELTDKQKLMPVSESSYASTEKESKSVAKTAKSEASTTATSDTMASTDAKPKKVIFRATKDQINAAQKILKEKNMYSGEETGKLDDATREGLKKYQDANSLKVTGTLNQITLEKMGIELTEKQKADAAQGNK